MADKTSEMLAFSFDTEISSFFWGLLAKSQPGLELLPESPTSQFLPIPSSPASPFLQLLVFPAKSERSLYSCIQYSATTAGVLAAAGAFSYCAYYALIKAREKLIDQGALKSTSEGNPEMPVIIRSESSWSVTSTSRSSRPDSLPLSSIPTENYLRILAKKTFSINGGVVRRVLGDADDESDEELEPSYFGPLAQKSSEDENEDELEEDHFMFPLEPPVSPTDSAYTSEHEGVARPVFLRLPNDNMEDHQV